MKGFMELGWNALSDVDYNALPALRSHDLSLILKSPLHYKTKTLLGETDALRIGRVLHKLILEPERAEGDIRVILNGDRRTKAGKEAHNAFLETLPPDALTVSEAEMARCRTIQKLVLGHEAVQKILSQGVAEVAGVYEDREGDVFKIKPDYRREDGIIVDLKTTTDVSARAFAHQALKYHYCLQAAFYLEIASLISQTPYTQFIWIVVEKEPPHDIALYLADIETIQYGRGLFQKAISLYKKCKMSNEWPGSPRQIQLLKLPTSAFLEM
jgi:hypothetical protein